jgi:excisionase family DNA binding protein
MLRDNDVVTEMALSATAKVHSGMGNVAPMNCWDVIRDVPGSASPMPNHVETDLDAGGRVTRTVPEAAQLLGLSESATYEAVGRGQIPAVKIGRRVLVKRDALLAMLTSAGPG